jgi:tetratricopeptide (TPR) repeat protein
MLKNFVAVLTLAVLTPAWGHADVDRQRHQDALEHYRLGEAAMFSEHWDDAEPEFQEAIKLDHQMLMAHHRLGDCHMAQHRYEEAMRAFLNARGVFKELSALQNSGSAEAEKQRDEEIRELRDSLTLLQSGTIKLGADGRSGVPPAIMKLESRIQQIEQSKQRRESPADEPPELGLALGSAFLRLGHFEDAEREYRAALRVRPRFGEAHNNLAVVYLSTGRLDLAKKEIAEADKCGFRVNPRLKEDILQRLAGN